MKYKAIIFDMDGLLIDSERIALSMFVQACRECDFEPDIEVYYRCIGTTPPQTKEIFRDGYGPDFPFEAISELWDKKYQEETLNKSVPLKEGALQLLKYLDGEGVKKAVATSTHQERARRKLANAKILHFFDFILSGDQILQGKPNPEIYLATCQRLGEEPAECLALEDSDNGVTAAFEAGLTVIQVPDLVEPSVRVQALGHKTVKSLRDVGPMLGFNLDP
ncbi:MAG: HAD family phosphatase [Dehalococcoidales bacterium]|jgi:HAD superfamily hydrolase (TIGR01509 family)|nr:HAD family phosphatase [Dehalococcoidales bacterium]MDP6632761.1 HAD family phosphatase [Dehalococcoidales bacterium]